MKFVETLKLTGKSAFTAIAIAGFSAIMVGSIFLIISLLVINSVDTAAFGFVNTTVANSTVDLTHGNIISSIGQALVISGVALIVVGVAVIIGVLLGMVGKPAGRM